MKITKEAIKQFEKEQKEFGIETAINNIFLQVMSEITKKLENIEISIKNN